MSKVKGYVGSVKIDDSGNVVRTDLDKEEAEEIANALKFNVQKGNEEARELGFSKMHGFAMFGSEKSLAFMKNKALLVRTKEADWQELFVMYTYIKSWLAGGIALIAISIVMFILAIFTSALDYFAPEPRLYLPSILLLIGVFMVGLSKTRFSYRLE
ncbi:MAG: hypothetical protein MPF33_01950 [Candidatus Aramenus sp.]|jgi:hypothetical protein|nr:hypothetical protein [Candidatus Aramenus sp.]